MPCLREQIKSYDTSVLFSPLYSIYLKILLKNRQFILIKYFQQKKRTAPGFNINIRGCIYIYIYIVFSCAPLLSWYKWLCTVFVFQNILFSIYGIEEKPSTPGKLVLIKRRPSLYHFRRHLLLRSSSILNIYICIRVVVTGGGAHIHTEREFSSPLKTMANDPSNCGGQNEDRRGALLAATARTYRTPSKYRMFRKTVGIFQYLPQTLFLRLNIVLYW